MKVLLVSATYQEIAPFVERLEDKVVQNNLHSGKLNSQEIDCLITGIGINAATYALTKYLQDNKYDLVINAGIAGCYNDTLPIGTVVVVKSDCFADLGIDDNGTFRTVFEEKLADSDEFPFLNGLLQNNPELPFVSGLQEVKGITVNTASGSKERIRFLKEKFNPDIKYNRTVVRG